MRRLLLSPMRGLLLLKDILRFLEEIAKNVLLIRVAAFFFQAFELLKQAFLLGAQVCRSHDLHRHVLIAARGAMDHRDAHIFQAERASALRPRWDFQGSSFIIDRWHLHLGPQCSLGKANRQLVNDIVAIAFKERMWLHRQDDIEIAGGTAARAHLALAGHADINAVIDAGGDIDLHASILAHASLAATLLAGSSNHASFAATALAHCHIDKLAKDRLLHAADLAGALAGRTTRGRRSGRGPCAVTGRAIFPAWQFNFFLAAEDRLL